MDFIPALQDPGEIWDRVPATWDEWEQWAEALEAMRLDGNFLAAEGLIVARLKSRFADPVKVLTAADIGGAKSLAQWCPAVFVMFDGYQVVAGPDGSANRGAAQLLDQMWTCVCAVRSAADPVSGSAVRVDAGAMFDTLFKALLGWQPSTQFRQVRLRNAPKPNLADGVGYFPASFTTRCTIQGEP